MQGDTNGAVCSLQVIEGRNLAAKDVGGTSDPYPVIGCVNDAGELDKKAWQFWRGPVKDFTLNPTWNSSFTIYPEIDGKLRPIRVEVWDKDKMSKDDFMGHITIDLEKDVPDNEVLDQWYPVQTRAGKKKDKVSGELHVVIHFASRDTVTRIRQEKEEEELRSQHQKDVERQAAIAQQEQMREAALEESKRDEQWRERFRGDTDFAQLDSWMQTVLKHGGTPEGMRRLCDLYNWIEADQTGGRAERFAQHYECIPMLLRILQRHGDRPLVCGVVCGCIAHYARTEQCYARLCEPEVLAVLVDVFRRHLTPPNFAQDASSRTQFTRLILAPIANLTATPQEADADREAQGRVVAAALPAVVALIHEHSAHPTLLMFALQLLNNFKNFPEQCGTADAVKSVVEACARVLREWADQSAPVVAVLHILSQSLAAADPEVLKAMADPLLPALFSLLSNASVEIDVKANVLCFVANLGQVAPTAATAAATAEFMKQLEDWVQEDDDRPLLLRNTACVLEMLVEHAAAGVEWSGGDSDAAASLLTSLLARSSSNSDPAVAASTLTLLTLLASSTASASAAVQRLVSTARASEHLSAITASADEQQKQTLSSLS